MLDTQPQERGTQQNTVRARKKPVGSSPPFGLNQRVFAAEAGMEVNFAKVMSL
jgi:hypothetical protein